jgi:acid stress-induced BolA-like protein IbaG/YrbA
VSPERVRERILAALPGTQIEVHGADCNLELLLVNPSFEGQSLLARQRAVLALFSAELATGTLHALSVRALTPRELEQRVSAAGPVPIS